MIRKVNKEDLDRIMEVWLNSNLEAHDFVDPNYWKSNFNYVKQAMQQADVFIYESNKQIYGFVGMTDNYLAGIFVDQQYRGNGVGTQLLDFIKKNFDSFTLSVYEKNKSALNFYLQQDLQIVSSDIDQDTNEKELIMKWVKEK